MKTNETQPNPGDEPVRLHREACPIRDTSFAERSFDEKLSYIDDQLDRVGRRLMPLCFHSEDPDDRNLAFELEMLQHMLRMVRRESVALDQFFQERLAKLEGAPGVYHVVWSPEVTWEPDTYEADGGRGHE